MNLFDVIAIVIVVAYAVLGFMSGAVRRVLGLVILYFACLVATYMGPHGGDVYRQYSGSTPVPDARLIGWVFFLLLVIVLLEGAATALHEHLQASVVALNETVGVILGAATGVILVVVLVFMLAGYAQPSGGGQLSSTELAAKEQLNRSALAVPLTKRIGAPIVVAMAAALPREASQFFITKTI